MADTIFEHKPGMIHLTKEAFENAKEATKDDMDFVRASIQRELDQEKGRRSCEKNPSGSQKKNETISLNLNYGEP